MTVTQDLSPFLEGLLAEPDDRLPWLASLRQDARQAFDREGLPGRRTEAWKYTRLNRVVETTFLPSVRPARPADLEAVPQIDGAFRVVLANGRLVPDQSMLDGLPEGVLAAGIAATLKETPERLVPVMGQALSLEGMPLAAINMVGFEDGVFIDVPAGVHVDRPIHIVNYTDGTEESVSSSPRFVFAAGEGASVDIVDHHCGTGRYFVNTVTEVFVGAGARIGHFKLQDEGPEAFHVAATGATMAAGGTYDSFVLQLGASLARNEIRALLDGETAVCRLNGAYVGSGEQHLDNTTFIDHAAPHAESREVYKGVLADTARGVFQGKILVRRGAQKTDGHQLNRALLLSRGAEIDSKPELEIYADDVKCSHGATAGELDETQLFYLRSRGIDEATARQILVEAFLIEVMDEIADDAVRSVFAEALGRKLGDVATAAVQGNE